MLVLDMAKKLKEVTEEAKALAEAQIKDQQKETKYDVRDFTVDYIVQQFQGDLFFIPDYQRKFIWPIKHRAEFIESLLLGLPIPMIFVAEIDDGRLEIVDGAQRIQTLEQFQNGDLALENLKILNSLNGFTYHDLSISQRRKFDTKALRVVVLEEATTVARRQEIFHRINTSAVKAKESEVRRGNYDSPFMRFIINCSTNARFLSACPISQALADRREYEELLLRFFAYSDSYLSFRHDVGKFLDEFLSVRENDFDSVKGKREFDAMVEFVSRYFPNGFAKSKMGKSTPRVRFEAISVGVNLALRERPNLVPNSMEWLNSEEFLHHTTTHASNSGPKLRGRIEYVRDQLLKV